MFSKTNRHLSCLYFGFLKFDNYCTRYHTRFSCKNFQFILKRHKMSTVELEKEAAAKAAVQEFVESGQVIGVGSGSTIKYVVKYLQEKVKKGAELTCVPTSFQSRQLIMENQMILSDLDTYTKLDLVIDGADEVDENKVLIKGGGGCLTQEKIVASCTDKLIIVADSSKKSQTLGEKWKKGLPIEVIPMSYVVVSLKIENLLGGKCHLRMGQMKAGPVITDNGNFILDWMFPPRHSDWKETNTSIKLIPGVVETGLFVNMATKVFFGMPDGTVDTI